MWMYKDTEREMLLNRIKDLERMNEILTGANQILTQELERAHSSAAKNLEKVFEVAGLNKIKSSRDERSESRPISLTKRGESWPKIRENLELESRKKYWEGKKKEQEAIDELEKEVLGEIKDASG